jgi:hypothetical protein
MGVDFVTRGDKVPQIADLRHRGGVSGPRQTNVYDASRAIQSYRLIKGRKPLRFYIKSFIGDVKTAVRSGKYVVCCIDYGTFNRVTGATGDPNYRGGHSIGVLGQRTLRNGTVQWRIFDPLDDARRQGIPKGPRWVAREDVVVPMEAFAKAKGRCFAGVLGGGGKR